MESAPGGWRRQTWNVLGVVAVLATILLVLGAGYALYPLLHQSAQPAATGGSVGVAVAAPSATATPDMDVFWQAWSLLDGSYYGDLPDATTRVRGAVRGMVGALGDPYTVYLDPEPGQMEGDRLRGSFGGIGATIEFTASEFVLHPLADQPAAQAGVREGDILKLVDALTITADLSSDEVVAHVRGPIGSTVTLGVRRAENADLLRIPVVRAEIRLPSIEARLLDAADGAPATAHIGYLRQTIFGERSADELRTAVQELRAQGADRFVWDLRGNPGGLVDAATATADIWLDGGIILIEEHADGSSKSFPATPGGEGVGLPLVLVVDGGSASASEIVAGALQDNQRARLVGERTFGKGSVQLVYELADRSSLHVTNAQWLTPNRRQISGNGLAPDIAVEAGADPLAAAIQAVLALP